MHYSSNTNNIDKWYNNNQNEEERKNKVGLQEFIVTILARKL